MSWEGERKEAGRMTWRLRNIMGRVIGVRFKIMGVQNSGEESRLERGYKNRTNG